MKIYTYPKSRSLRVLWAMEEMQTPYESVKVDLLSPSSKVKSPHPYGKVPFLSDGDWSVSETLAICIYLCEQYPATTLYPTEPKEKALVNSWLSFAISDLEAPVWGLLKQLFLVAENERSQDVICYFKKEASKVVSQVHLDADRAWIAGDHFTLADIFMSHTLLWAKLCAIELDVNAENYVIKAMSRPAFLKAQEKNNQ